MKKIIIFSLTAVLIIAGVFYFNKEDMEVIAGGTLVCGVDDVTFTYNGEMVTYGTVESEGRCWMDRNLGAVSYNEEDPTTHEPSSKDDHNFYGDLFQ